jgi:hypothetical protein
MVDGLQLMVNRRRWDQHGGRVGGGQGGFSAESLKLFGADAV